MLNFAEDGFRDSFLETLASSPPVSSQAFDLQSAKRLSHPEPQKLRGSSGK